MNRVARTVLSLVVAAGVVLAPTAAGASDENVVYAVNRTDGGALVRASVDFREVTNGKVEAENRAYAVAQVRRLPDPRRRLPAGPRHQAADDSRPPERGRRRQQRVRPRA